MHSCRLSQMNTYFCVRICHPLVVVYVYGLCHDAWNVADWHHAIWSTDHMHYKPFHREHFVAKWLWLLFHNLCRTYPFDSGFGYCYLMFLLAGFAAIEKFPWKYYFPPEKGQQLHLPLYQYYWSRLWHSIHQCWYRCLRSFGWLIYHRCCTQLELCSGMIVSDVRMMILFPRSTNEWRKKKID